MTASRSIVSVVALAAAFLFGLQNGNRPEIHCTHFFYGYPHGAPATNDMIIRGAYALSSNDATKFADWVCYRLDPTMVANLSDPERKWRADPWLAANETLEPNDYNGAHGALDIDRGHQAPLASFKSTPYTRDTNYLSNITPQQSDLNQGPWARLEEAVRGLVRTNREVWVMTGPLYEDAMDPLPGADETHTVPSGYWKIVSVGEINNPASIRTVGFIMGQGTARDADFEDLIERIDEIENRCGLDFFWDGVPTHVETQLENAVGTWPPQGN